MSAYVSDCPQPLRPHGRPNTQCPKQFPGRPPSTHREARAVPRALTVTPQPPGLFSHPTSLSCTPDPSPAPPGLLWPHTGDAHTTMPSTTAEAAPALFPRQARVSDADKASFLSAQRSRDSYHHPRPDK